MSQAEKSALYQELKTAGVQFDKQYRQYTTDELKAGVNLLRERTGQPSVEQQQAQAVLDAAATAAAPLLPPAFITPAHAAPVFHQEPAPVYIPQLAPDTDAGIRQNTGTDQPRRIDENGLAWYQDEIRKPSFPKPRARRVLRYTNPGVKQETIVNGQFLETFEVAGGGQAQGEIKITLPSYQVGIYADPRFPFKIHIYNEIRGFDLFEVQEYYGGDDLVPTECKKMYVENVLCYDIRTVVRAIETEHRQMQLNKQIGL